MIQTVTLNLTIDLSNPPPSGTFLISDGATSAAGDVTCLFISGSSAVIGVYLPGSGLYGLLSIIDNSPAALDTLWLDTPNPDNPADCTSSPVVGSELVNGEFTVTSAPPPSIQPSPLPSGIQPSPLPSITPPPPPPDANFDGIVDTLQPGGTLDGSFLDESLNPPTFGSIVSTGGLTVTVTDAPDPSDGVVITVGSGAPGSQAELLVCGGFTVLLDEGTWTTGTCGSIRLQVAAGTAHVVLGDGITIISIPTGAEAKVSDNGDGSYDVENTGSQLVTLTVDGTTSQIETGGTTTAQTWDFVGFGQPIDDLPIINRLAAGQAVPIKWRLLDSSGAPITNLAQASFNVTTVDCALATTIDQVEESVAGSSGLLNLGNGYYQLNWKSPASYAKSCKTFHLNVGDGVSHDALFQFTK